MEYEPAPAKKYKVRKDGKGSKMSKTPKTDAPAPTTIKKGRSALEVFQTVVIFVLITAIAAFYGGMQFEQSRQAQIDAAVKSAQVAPAPVKK